MVVNVNVNMQAPYKSATYRERAGHIVLVLTAILCLLFVLTVCGLLGWYVATYRQDEELNTHTNGSTLVISNTETNGQTPNVSDAELSAIAQTLWSSDLDRLQEDDYVLHLQTQLTSNNTRDQARDSLFSHLRVHVETHSVTFQTLVSLLSGYTPILKQPDVMTREKKEDIGHFLDAILDTQVMKETHKFLFSKGYVGKTVLDFRQSLYSLWFEPYHRSPKYNTTDSSGFEHVFLGEYKGRRLKGFHSWVHFYMGELEGRVNYYGYLTQQEPRILAVQFSWDGRFKSLGTFFIGTSPEFEMAIYTICAMTRTNSRCKFRIDNYPVEIETVDINFLPGLQVQTAYPVVLV